jgi:serine/threonine protein kinase
LTWRQFDHPNIVKFLGVYREQSEGRQRLSLVSTQIEHHLRAFIRSAAYNPRVDRKRLVGFLVVYVRPLTNFVSQLCEIASALVYLHDQGIAHGDVSLVCYLFDSLCTEA